MFVYLKSLRDLYEDGRIVDVMGMDYIRYKSSKSGLYINKDMVKNWNVFTLYEVNEETTFLGDSCCIITMGSEQWKVSYDWVNETVK